MPTIQFAGVRLTAPDTYIDCTVYAIASTNSQGPFQRNLTINFEPLAGRELNQMLHAAQQQLLQLGQPTLRFGAKSRLRISEREAASMEYATDEMTLAGPLRLIRRLVFLPIDDRVLVATFTATESDFATYATELDAILSSIQV